MNVAYWVQNKRAFTLIEVLLVLFLFLLVVSFFSTFVLTIKSGYQTNKVTFQQVTMFFNQINQDIKTASSVEVAQAALILRRKEMKDIEIKLLPSGQMRRTSDGEGNVLLLEDVNSFTCSLNKQLLTCRVITKGLDVFEKTFLLSYGDKVEGS